MNNMYFHPNYQMNQMQMHH